MDIKLRKFLQKDLVPINNWVNNPTVTAQVIDSEIFTEPHSLEMTQGFLDSCFSEDDYQKMYVVTQVSNDEYIGQVRLYEIDIENLSSKIDIVLSEPELWNKGLGKSAITELVKLGYENFNLNTFYADVPTKNERAHSLFLALGFESINDNNEITKYAFKK